ncbi:MAG: hypothetical protein U0946_01655, partial [Patescibacteria group bacterium]|nr:hypothetical protein [Patescibacteria group bacterium]
SQKLGVTVTASANLKLDDEISSFVQDAQIVSGCNRNARTLIDKQETAVAEDVYQHTPEKAKDASAEDLQKSIDGLQEAASSLSNAMETLSKSSNPDEKINDELIKSLVEKIGAEKPTVKLTAESLQDPFKLSESLNKMVTGLKAIQDLKKSGGSLEQQEILKSIKNQLRQLSQQLGGQQQTPPAAQGGETPSEINPEKVPPPGEG